MDDLQYSCSFFFNYAKSGAANAWDKTKETTKDATNATVKKGGEATDAVKSGACSAGRKTKEAAGNVKDATAKKTGEGADAVKKAVKQMSTFGRN